MDIRNLCLGLLTLGDASGYEIKQVFEDQLSHFYAASFGSIYPALTRLTEQGLVSCRAEAQSKRPDKKVYSITPAGRLAFLDALAEPPAPDRVRSDFLAVMMFADLLPANRVAELIDRRIAAYRAALNRFAPCEDGAASPAHRFLAGYGRAVYQAEIDYLQENRHLVESQALLARPAAAE